MISYKIDVLDALKKKGYSTYRLRKEKILGENTIECLRNHQSVSFSTLNTLCRLLDCKVGDIIYYKPDDPSTES